MSLPEPGNCLTCGNTACSLRRDTPDQGGRRAFVLDECWPEFRSFLARERRGDDQILAPGLFGRAGLPRYDWGPGIEHRGTAAVLARHGAMRLVRDKPGALRQPVYLRHDEAMGRALFRHLDYHADRLVIDQRLLPFAWRAGVLGGRHYDVVMTRYPLAALHAALDAQATANPASRTLADFRAPPDLVADEAAALAGAARIVTPHHGIAALFGPRALRLDWVVPAPVPARRGDRIAFLGPAIGRAGLATARDLAARLRRPLIVFGPDLEGGAAWAGVAVERRAFGPGWLDDIGAIIHPAAMTHQPRRLLQAIANGVRVHATAGAGLASGQWHPLAEFDPAVAR